MLLSAMLIISERHYRLIVELIDTRHNIKLKFKSSSRPQIVVNQGFKVIIGRL